MTIPLFIFLLALLITGVFIQKWINKTFIRYIYHLIPENYFPEKVNKIRKKTIELMPTLFMIAVGISPTSNLILFKTPNIQLNSLLFEFTIWYGVVWYASSYIVAIFLRSLKYLNS
jgi:sterol desaturase/sphingolipid hydroxylase (fatty acid hydroxylase superfamily)